MMGLGLNFGFSVLARVRDRVRTRVRVRVRPRPTGGNAEMWKYKHDIQPELMCCDVLVPVLLLTLTLRTLILTLLTLIATLAVGIAALRNSGLVLTCQSSGSKLYMLIAKD